LLDGILHLNILNESWKGATFYQFIDALLNNMNTFPRQNALIVMDNASIHHSPELQELIEAWYMFICINFYIHTNLLIEAYN